MVLGLIIALFCIVLFIIAIGKLSPILTKPYQFKEVVDTLSSPPSPRKLFSRSFRWILIGCSLMAFAAPLLQYLGTASFGSRVFLELQILPILLLVAVTPISALSLLLLFLPRCRPFAIRTIIASSLAWSAYAIGEPIGKQIRTDAFHRLAERSTPLVNAIRNYEASHGTAPPDLNSLVPQFLPSVPDTGMGAYPHYQYHVGDEAISEYEGNPWALVVLTPAGGINWDCFLYFPLGNYPEMGYGGSLERIRDWAYVHE